MAKMTQWRSAWPKNPPGRVYIAVDPGETTGVAMWKRTQPDEVVLKELRPRALRNYLMRWFPVRDACFFSERFDIGNETVRVTPPIDSLYINGWMAMNLGPRRYCEVTRADAKGFTSNKKLRHYGWWQVGSKDHCRDAGRVLALAMSHYNEPWLLDQMTSYAEELADG